MAAMPPAVRVGTVLATLPPASVMFFAMTEEIVVKTLIPYANEVC